MKKVFGIILVLILAGGYFYFHRLAQVQNSSAVASTTTKVIKIGDTQVQVDVADTDALREQGLSGRESLCDKCGMLFIFDRSAQYGFWMKDMKFSLDIIWINAEKKVVGIERDLSPSTYPKSFMPSEPVLYVLEVPAGFSLANGVKIGSNFNLILRPRSGLKLTVPQS